MGAGSGMGIGNTLCGLGRKRGATHLVCVASGAGVAGDGACSGVDSGGPRLQNGRGRGECEWFLEKS